jgi:thiopeptide-type bacteriocin biosynthesis protein
MLPTHEWLYYRIYVADDTEADRLLEYLVRPALDRLRAEVPGLRWFFLRFVDPTGMHLRLRLCAELPAVNHMAAVLDRLLSAAQSDGAVRFAGEWADRPVTCQGFGKALYVPETAKFGAGAGIRLAETLFQASSSAALDCVGPRYATMRVGYGAANVILLLAGLPASVRPSFLHQYAWYWSGGPASKQPGKNGGALAAVNGRGASQLAGKLVNRAAEVLSQDTARHSLAGYATRFWHELRSEQRRLVPRSDYFLLFHHLHLMNNRLGVFSVAEARIARLLFLAGPAGPALAAAIRARGDG